MKKRLQIAVLLFIAVGVSLAFYYEKRGRTGEAPNLLENLNYVEQIWDSKYIDLGSAAFQPSLVRGWSGSKTDPDGTTYEETYTKTASLRFSCLHKTDRTIQVRCRTIPGSSRTQILIPMVNGNKLHGQRITDHFQPYSFDVPDSILNRGMNSLTFYFSLGRENAIKKLGTAFDSITLAEKNQTESAQALARSHSAFSDFQPAVDKGWFKTSSVVTAPPDSSLSLYIRVPEQSALKLGYGLGAGDRGSSCRFTVTIQSESRINSELMSRTIENRLLFPSSATDYLDLRPYGNRYVRIGLQASPVPGMQPPEKIHWDEARLITSSLNPAPRFSPEFGRGLLASRKTNVIIYLIDAQRADHLEPYGYPRPTSPNINEFSKTSVVFEKAYAQVSWTRASVASIQSGLYPSSHLVEDRLDAFPDNLPDLQSELRKHGYRAYGFVTNGNISSLFNFSKDFDNYIRLGEDKRRKEIHVQSDELYSTVEGFFNQNSYSVPMFLYVHATDPHAPYTPDPEFAMVAEDCDRNDPEMYNQHGTNARVFSRKEIDCMMSLYDSETRRADHNFGKLLNLLKVKNLYDNSIIIVTADHGESFFEHGIWGHGKSLYESEIRVPIIMHFPDNRFAGKRIQENVRHIDLFPTILSAFGVPAPVSVQGRSLLPLLLDHPVEEVPVFSELLLDQYSRLSIVYDGYKLIDNGKGTKYELYDLRTDPLEKENVVSQEPIRFNYMRFVMNRWADEQARRKAVLKKPKGAVLDKETEDILKALGYLQ